MTWTIVLAIKIVAVRVFNLWMHAQMFDFPKGQILVLNLVILSHN